MSNITEYQRIAAQSVSSCSTQTHRKVDKWTHANLNLRTASVRPYGKNKQGCLVFIELKEKYQDPAITELLSDIDSVLTESIMELEELPRMCFSSKITRNNRKTKRGEPFDRRLESIFESPIVRDVGTDPMPDPDVLNKATQVSINELFKLSSPLYDDCTGHCSPKSLQIPAKFQGPVQQLQLNAENSPGNPRNIRVFVERPVFDLITGASIRTNPTPIRNPWALVGLGSAPLRRRPVLAPIESAHIDALQRLETLDAFTANIFNEMNRQDGNGTLTTVNEIPVTQVSGRSGTMRFRRRMIQQNQILNINGYVLQQSEINNIFITNAHHVVPSNPFGQTRRFRRLSAEPAAVSVSGHAAYRDAPFWQRLGIPMFVPRLWLLETVPRRATVPSRVGGGSS